MAETKSIFVHIPKTGGKAVLTNLYGVDVHETLGHASIHFFHGTFGPDRFARCFRFAFVRNPWGRLYSGFRFLKNGGFGLEEEKPLQATLRELSFSDFVKHALPTQDLEANPVFRPQWRFICNPDGRLLVDRVCRFEKIAQEYEWLRRRIGIGRPLTVENRSGADFVLAEVYDREMIEIVRSCYRRDIELFGYECVAEST